MTAVGALALSTVVVALLVLGGFAIVRLLAGALDDAVSLPGRGRHRHPDRARSTRRAGAALRAGDDRPC